MLSYNKIAEFYDEDMGKNSAGKDVAFYVQQCTGAQTLVLELGCGTGRISLALIKAGLEVVGIDTSLAMLRQLRSKAVDQLSSTERARLHYCQMDMCAFAFNVRFGFILCPFSAFFYLLDYASQVNVLAAIRSHLVQNGLFLLDIFIPDLKIMALPTGYIFHDYERTLADGRILRRTKTIHKTATLNVNFITRHYVFLDQTGREIQTITTEQRIHYHFPGELKSLLEQNGFDVIKILADFQNQAYDDQTRTVAMICKPVLGNMT
jgi:SAM-dependent methyltransferase